MTKIIFIKSIVVCVFIFSLISFSFGEDKNIDITNKQPISNDQPATLWIEVTPNDAKILIDEDKLHYAEIDGKRRYKADSILIGSYLKIAIYKENYEPWISVIRIYDKHRFLKVDLAEEKRYYHAGLRIPDYTRSMYAKPFGFRRSFMLLGFSYAQKLYFPNYSPTYGNIDAKVMKYSAYDYHSGFFWGMVLVDTSVSHNNYENRYISFKDEFNIELTVCEILFGLQEIHVVVPAYHQEFLSYSEIKDKKNNRFLFKDILISEFASSLGFFENIHLGIAGQIDNFYYHLNFSKKYEAQHSYAKRGNAELSYFATILEAYYFEKDFTVGLKIDFKHYDGTNTIEDYKYDSSKLIETTTISDEKVIYNRVSYSLRGIYYYESYLQPYCELNLNTYIVKFQPDNDDFNYNLDTKVIQFQLNIGVSVYYRIAPGDKIFGLF